MSTSPKRSQAVSKNTTGGVKSSPAVFDLSRPDFNLPFFHYLTIPKNTTADDPFIYNMPLPFGMVRRLWVEFPRGCAGFAGIRILRGVNQIFPLPDGIYLRSDNSVMNFAFSHVINTEPNEVILQGINTDDTYSHTIWIGFEMSGISKEATDNLKGFLDLIGS